MSPESIIDLRTFNSLQEEMGQDFIAELLQAYFDEIPQLLVKLQESLAKQDCETFQRTAHSIKSTSNTFGALQFGLQARELEMMGKAGNLDGAPDKVTALVDTYHTVRHTLEELNHA
jgi:HPt (histidine-containing phosphotransfer) domain-containing protein